MGSGRPACPGLWKTPVIRWDGRLNACCADVDGEIEVGSLHEHSFEALWEGPRMTQYRLWHIQGEFEQMPKCFHCGGINFYALTLEEIQAWLEEIGRPELLEPYKARLGWDV